MTNEEQNSLRAMLREEVNAAVYASEQRLRQELHTTISDSEQRLRQELHTTISDSEQRLGNRLDSIEQRLSRTEFIQTQMAANVAKMGLVLNEATIKINELQKNMIALENKLDESILSLRRDMQNIAHAVNDVSTRLNIHMHTPINEAHPPGSAL